MVLIVSVVALVFLLFLFIKEFDFITSKTREEFKKIDEKIYEIKLRVNKLNEELRKVQVVNKEHISSLYYQLKDLRYLTDNYQILDRLSRLEESLLLLEKNMDNYQEMLSYINLTLSGHLNYHQQNEEKEV